MATQTLGEMLVGIGFGLKGDAEAQLKQIFARQTAMLDKADKDYDRKADQLAQAHTKRLKDHRDRVTRERAAAVKAVNEVEAKVLSFATVTAGAMTGLVYATTRVAQGFEGVFYQSQRVGASATNLKAMTYGLSQMGTTAEAANSSIENFARTLRTNPGFNQVLERLGVRTKDAKGAQRDTTELFADFGKALRGKSAMNQAQYLEMFGVDERTGAAVIKGVGKFADEYREKMRAAGLDPESAEKDGAKLAQTFRSLGGSIEVISARVTSQLFNDQNNTFKRFVDFLDKNGGKIADLVAKLSTVVFALTEALVKLATSDRVQAFLDTLLDNFGKVDEATGKWEADIGKLQTALEVFATFIIGTWMLRFLTAFSKVGAGWAGLLRIFGIPLAVGLAASGGGHMTPEGYKDALASDSGRAAADAELNKQGGAGKRWWKKHAPTWLGGDPAGAKAVGGVNAETGIARRGRRSRRAEEIDKTTYHFTGENADVTRAAAKELGTTPEALAAVISYETGGTFSPKKWGGKGGNYMGLIQFGPEERRTYGANENQTYAEQMGAVVRYLKSRGFRPGMDLRDLYSTINAGRPGRYNASDGNGTVQSHSERIAREHMGRAKRFLASGAPKPKLKMDDILPGGLGGAMGGGIPSFSFPQTAPNAADYSRSSSVTVNQGAINVTGVSDPHRAADHVGRVQGYRTSDLIRNMRSSVG